MIQDLLVKHHTHISDRGYDAVVADLMAATGSVEEGFDAVASEPETAAAFEAVFRAREGASGFMRFAVVDHGRWLGKLGRPARAVLVILGNPLIAETMLRHDIAAGLNVPVRLSVFEGGDGKTRVSFDLPSTLMSFTDDRDLASAARRLDEKLIALVAAISGVQA